MLSASGPFLQRLRDRLCLAMVTMRWPNIGSTFPNLSFVYISYITPFRLRARNDLRTDPLTVRPSSAELSNGRHLNNGKSVWPRWCSCAGFDRYIDITCTCNYCCETFIEICRPQSTRKSDKRCWHAKSTLQMLACHSDSSWSKLHFDPVSLQKFDFHCGNMK